MNSHCDVFSFYEQPYESLACSGMLLSICKGIIKTESFIGIGLGEGKNECAIEREQSYERK